MFDKKKHMSKGWGFCTYVDSESVDSVMRARPHILEYRTLEIKRAARKDQAGSSKGDVQTKSLYVSGIELDMSILVLRELFSQFGKVININILMDQEAALVEFDDWDAVDKACLQENIFVNDIEVKVKKHVAQSSVGGRNRDGDEESNNPETVHERKLCVFNVSFTTSEQQLKQYFGKYGEIESLALMYDNNTRRSKGWGFITFRESATIDAILADRPHRIDDRVLETKRALRKDNPEPKTNRLQASGVPEDMSEDDICEEFSQFGTVVNVNLLIDRQGRSSNSFAYIEFVDTSSVDEAVLKREIFVNGTRLQLKRDLTPQQLKKAGLQPDGKPIRNSDPSDDDVQLRKLFVAQLNFDTTEDKLREYFEKYGELEDVRINRDQMTGKSKGYGFVTFADISGVDAVQKARPHTITKRTVKTVRSVRKEQKGTAEAKLQVKKLFVRGIKYDMNKEDLKEVFSQFGKVVSAHIPVDKATGNSRNYGFIEYDDTDCVDKACLWPLITIKGREVTVRKAPDQDGPSNRDSSGKSFGGREMYDRSSYMDQFGPPRGGYGGGGYDGGYGSGSGSYGGGPGGYGGSYSGYDGPRGWDRRGTGDRYGQDMGSLGAMRSSGFSNRSAPYYMGGSDRNNRS
ncbi:unnamed protein product [Meganyctiphanes norvegica]|uniref:RRM domain-containing protein n=1 Tax=Meganyctiphanes norvegica TaxID=48144 RepID=A0AAV2RIJ3_MEGNR